METHWIESTAVPPRRDHTLAAQGCQALNDFVSQRIVFRDSVEPLDLI